MPSFLATSALLLLPVLFELPLEPVPAGLLHFARCRQVIQVFRAGVEQVAEFLSSGVPELVDYRAFDLVDRVVQRASFAWMKDHSALFDDHFAWKAMVLPALSTSGVGMQPPDKVVDGRVGDGQRRLIPEARQLLIRQWESARPGNCANYDKLRRKYGRFGVFSGPRSG